MGHCANDGSQYDYQGKEFQCICFDEAGQFLPKQLSYLFSRCRSTNPNIRKRIRYATNPGGPAHQWLKDRFRIGEYPQGNITFAEEIAIEGQDSQTITRRFIPAKLADNPTLALNDPTYIALLNQLSPVEKMRLLHGIWDSFEGQSFTEINREVHGYDPKVFQIPPEWTRFRTFDWGYSTPFVVQWWAVDYEGDLYHYREWYGAKKDEARNGYTGMKMTASEIAQKIVEIEEEDRRQGCKVNIGPADPSIWHKRRDVKTGVLGISVADEMMSCGINWLKADNDRVLGKQQFHSRLRLDDDGDASIHVSYACEHWWRTIPMLQEDPRNVEDVEHETQEDHCYDCTRYAIMHHQQRPKVRTRSEVGTFAYEQKRYKKARQYATRYGVDMSRAYGMVR
jgi:hypothetical protein